MPESLNHHEDHEELRGFVARFRNAIEQCDRANLPEWFEFFPLGCCGDTVDLLARFLSDHGLGNVQKVWGCRTLPGECEKSHAWIRSGELIIDITADQFDEIREAVLVTKDHTWHETFEIRGVEDAHFPLNDFVRSYMEIACVAILEKLKND